MLKASTSNHPECFEHKGITENRKLGTLLRFILLISTVIFPVSLKSSKCKHQPRQRISCSETENRLHVRAIYTVSFPLFEFRWVFRFYRGGVYE